MMIVPKGKTVYVGARKFVAGDVIPPALAIRLPDGKPVDEYKQEKVTRKYTRRER